MIELSVLVPARNERWLGRTVADVLAASSEATEIIVVLDGAWPEESLPQDPRVQVVYLPESIGQRAATNLAARVSTARFVMKLDAHVSMAPGFDRVLIDAAERLGPRVCQVPAQKNLHIYDRVCRTCGKRNYQGPPDRACDCGGACDIDVVWKPRGGTTTTCWYFDTQPKFNYATKGLRQRQAWKDDIADVMTSLGACFFMTREFFLEIGGLEESHGSWGSFGIEVALKSVLSGGRHVTNRGTWFAHFFRVGGIGFPYPIRGSEQDYARRYARNLWFGNNWPGQVRPLSWLIEKFAPLPDWHEPSGAAALAEINAAGLRFPPRAIVGAGVRASADDTSAAVCAVRNDDECMALRTMGASAPLIAQASTPVDGTKHEIKVSGIAASTVPAQMIELRDVSGCALRDSSVDPRVDEPVREIHLSPEGEAPVSAVASAGPVPAAGSVDANLRKQPRNGDAVQVGNGEKLSGSHSSDLRSDVRLGADSRSQREAVPSILAKHPTKACVFYSDCRPDPRILAASQRSIESSGMPIVAVTLAPIRWPSARNIVLPLERGVLSMFKQILAGLEALDTDIAFLCEHDVAYSKTHFQFTPPSDSIYYYNTNVWKIDAATGRALHYRCNQTSGLCANRQLLIEHYRKRVAHVEAHGYSRSNGFEPGTRKTRHGGFDDVGFAEWQSELPNVDIRHAACLTPSRWRKDQFRNQKYTEGWTEADGPPGLGITKGRFWEWLAEASDAAVRS